LTVARGRDLGPGDQLEFGAEVEAIGLRVVDDDRPEHIGVDLPILEAREISRDERHGEGLPAAPAAHKPKIMASRYRRGSAARADPEQLEATNHSSGRPKKPPARHATASRTPRVVWRRPAKRGSANASIYGRDRGRQIGIERE
jgi:hypothetical protein